MTDLACSNCGYEGPSIQVEPIDEDLREAWQLSNKLTRLFNFREGSLCGSCHVNIRAQSLAKAIMLSKFGSNEATLKEWVENANKKRLRVCELNSCHNLHDTLKKIDDYEYAEYGTPSEQDIENLTYEDDSFDIVLHSETLEHVSNPGRAMQECRRVLKPGGLVIFTTPVVWLARTRRRAMISKGKIEHILPPSYHGFKTDDYLVFYEFGYDIDNILRSDIVYEDPKNQSYVFGSKKEGSYIPKLEKARIRFNQLLHS